MDLKLTSNAFAKGDAIPRRYTCQGDDVSPMLKWTGAPEGTKSFALICDDPDAPRGTWVHWVIYNIPADAGSLAEGIPGSAELPNDARQGINDFQNYGYGGPCPPAGGPHRYYFKLYALDIALDLKPGATKKELLAVMQGHALAQGRLMGKYERE